MGGWHLGSTKSQSSWKPAKRPWRLCPLIIPLGGKESGDSSTSSSFIGWRIIKTKGHTQPLIMSSSPKPSPFPIHELCWAWIPVEVARYKVTTNHSFVEGGGTVLGDPRYLHHKLVRSKGVWVPWALWAGRWGWGWRVKRKMTQLLSSSISEITQGLNDPSWSSSW